MKFIHKNITDKDTKDSQRGRGLFATGKIFKGELISDNEGETRILGNHAVRKLPKQWQNWCYQIDDERQMCPKDFEHPAIIWFMNHSCDPNVGSLPGLHQLVAIRDIEPGEEITYDYAMTDAGDWEMECFCGKPNCRKMIRGTDWMLSGLQERYKGFFQHNIQEKIDAFKSSKKL